MPSLARGIRLVVTAWAATLASLAPSSAAAQDTGKLYAGVGLGVSDFTSDHEGIGYGDTPVGWQLYGGLQARELMAVELAVERLAGMGSQEVPGSGVERLRISADHSSVTLRGVFRLSLEEVLRRRQKISVFGTVGVARLVEERNVMELTASRRTSVTERDTAFVLGAGVTFDVARVRLRTYIQSADRVESDLNSLGVAAEFRF